MDQEKNKIDVEVNSKVGAIFEEQFRQLNERILKSEVAIELDKHVLAYCEKRALEEKEALKE